MHSHQDDLLSRPYEEWTESADARAEINKQKQQQGANSTKLLAALSFGLLLALSSLLVHYYFFSEAIFVPSRSFSLFTLVGIASLSGVTTLIILIARVRRTIELRLSIGLLSLPAGLLFGWLFLHPLANFVGAAWTAVAHDTVEGQLVLFSSKRSAGRSCRFRNDFYVQGFDSESFWCSPEPLKPATYRATVKFSSVGALVLCREDPNESVYCSSCAPWPNPSVKGTSCGKPQDAPYVER